MNLWNGKPMATARTTSILDAAEAALERCGAKASPAGISPERVRLLIREQAKKFAHVKMPSTPAPERALKMTQKERMDKWLAIPGNRERKAASDKAYRESNKKRITESRGTPEYRAARAERIREDRASNPEKYRKAEMKKDRANGVLPRKEAFVTKVKATLHGAVTREKARATLKQKGSAHPSARTWSLISPNGLVFRFRNLAAFVESHRDLFTEDQLTPVSSKKGRPTPRVTRSLAMLSPRKKHPCETMHGWRWYIDGKHHETLLSVLPLSNHPSQQVEHRKRTNNP